MTRLRLVSTRPADNFLGNSFICPFYSGTSLFALHQDGLKSVTTNEGMLCLAPSHGGSASCTVWCGPTVLDVPLLDGPASHVSLGHILRRMGVRGLLRAGRKLLGERWCSSGADSRHGVSWRALYLIQHRLGPSLRQWPSSDRRDSENSVLRGYQAFS